eukprot:511804-Hanusia_phi.AAC.1
MQHWVAWAVRNSVSREFAAARARRIIGSMIAGMAPAPDCTVARSQGPRLVTDGDIQMIIGFVSAASVRPAPGPPGARADRPGAAGT